MVGRGLKKESGSGSGFLARVIFGLVFEELVGEGSPGLVP